MAQELGARLSEEFSIIPSEHAIAVSEYLRTEQTALAMGASAEKLILYTVLNEVSRERTGADLRIMLDRGFTPPEAISHAEILLQNPPKEDIWVTHGLVIAGLCTVLGVYRSSRTVPKFCEIRDLCIDTI